MTKYFIFKLTYNLLIQLNKKLKVGNKIMYDLGKKTKTNEKKPFKLSFNKNINST